MPKLGHWELINHNRQMKKRRNCASCDGLFRSRGEAWPTSYAAGIAIAATFDRFKSSR